MAITNFVPELWSAAVQVGFEKELIYSQPTVANRDYEGTLTQMGDTVHVTSIGAPTIRTYDKTTDITIEDLSDSDTAIIVNQGKYWAFRVNDVDKAQAAGNFQSPAMDLAGAGIKDALDQYVASLYYAGADAANKVGRLTVWNGADFFKPNTGQVTAYDALAALKAKLDAQSVPSSGRYAILDAGTGGALAHDSRLLSAATSGSDQTLRNGIIGRVLGFDVMVSNNAPLVGGAGADQNDRVICAGVRSAVSVAQQLLETEALRSELRFADVVRGLSVYGGKVMMPKGIATATITMAAGVAA